MATGDAESLVGRLGFGVFSSEDAKSTNSVNDGGLTGDLGTLGYSGGRDSEVLGTGEESSCERVESGSWTDLQRTLCLIPDSGNPPHHAQHDALRGQRGSPRPPRGRREPNDVVDAARDGRADHEDEGGDAFVPDGVSVGQGEGEQMEGKGRLSVQVLSPKFGQIFTEGTTKRSVFSDPMYRGIGVCGKCLTLWGVVETPGTANRASCTRFDNFFAFMV